MNPINDEFYKIINESKDFKGMFSTKEELESTINKNPKEFYSIINESEDFKGIFKDENDLLNTAGLKKKVSSEDGGQKQKPSSADLWNTSSLTHKKKEASFWSELKSSESELKSKSEIDEKAVQTKAEKFLGAGKYKEPERVKIPSISTSDIELELITKGGIEEERDQLSFVKPYTPIIPQDIVIKNQKQKGVTRPEMTVEETMAQLDLYKDVPQQDEKTKLAFLQEGTSLASGELKGKREEKRQEIKSFIDREEQENRKLITSKPTIQEKFQPEITLNIKSINGDITPDSPDGTDTGWWKNEIENYKNTGQIQNVMTEFQGRKMEMPLPLKKVLEDYYYFIYNNDQGLYKRISGYDMSDRELMNITLAAIDHQQRKLETEYKAKKGEGAFPLPNEIYKGFQSTDWKEEDVKNAMGFLQTIAQDYFEKSGEALPAEYRDQLQEERLARGQQRWTDIQYDKYVEDGGMVLNPIDGLYYNFYQPAKGSTQDFVRGVLTLPRTVGLDEDFKVFDWMVDAGDTYFNPDTWSTDVPTKIKDEGFTWNNAIPKMVRGLFDFAYLIGGTKGLSAAGLSQKASLMMSSYAFSNDNYFNEGINAGMSKEEAKQYANITTGIQTALEFISPNKSLLEGFKIKVTPNVVRDIAQGKSIKESFKTRTKEWLKEIGQEEAQEFSQLFAEKGTNYLWNKATGSKLNDDITASEMLETGIVTFAVTGLANSGRFRPSTDMSNIALYQLSTSDNEVREKMIRDEVEKGTITQEQGQNLIDKTNEFRQILSGIPNKYNPKQKMEMASVIYQKKIVEKENKEKIIDPIFEQEQPKTEEKLNEELTKIKQEYDTQNEEQQVEGTVGSGETTEQRVTEQGSSSEEAKASGVLQEGEEIESPTLYHATVEDFESLKPFSHIGTKEQADKRVPEGREGKRIISGKMKGKVVHLGEDVVNWRKQILEETYEGGEKAFSQKFFKENPELKGEELQKKYDEEIQKYLKEKGIVGFSYDNKTEGEGLSYIIADPNAFIEDKVNEQVDIEDGHHRYIAYKEAGVKEVPVVNEKGEEMMMPIEKLRPTEKLEEKDRSTIDSIKESIGKGEKIEPIKVVSEVKIDEVRPQEKEGSERWDKKVMGKLDELEKNLDDFSKETLGINLPVAVAKSALKVMKGVIKTAGTIQDVVQAGIDHIKNTDWYLGLGENDRRLVEDEIEYRFNKPFGVAKKTAGRKAKANRKRISRAARNKNTLANDKPVFKSFATLNPSKVDDLDKYIEISNKILDIKKTGDRDITNEDIEKYVSEQTEILKEKQKAELLSDNQDLVDAGIISADMSLEDIQTILENPDSIEDEEKKKILKEKKVEKVKTLKSKIDVKIATLLEDMEPETELQGEVFSALQNIDLDGLKLDQLNIVNRVVDNIITNGSFAKAGDIILMNEIQQANRELAVELDRLGIDSIESFIKNNQNALNSLFKEYQIGIASLPSLIKKMTLNRDLAAVVRRVTGIQELLSGHAKVINEMDSLNEGFEKLVDNDNSSYDSQIKQSFYSIVSQDFGGNENDIQKEFERNKDLVRQTAVRSAQDEVRRLFDDGEIDKSKYEDFNGKRNSEGEFEPGLIEQGVATSSDLKKEFPEGDFTELAVYDSIIKDAKNSEEVREKLNDSEKKMVDYFRSKYAEIQERLFENAEMFDNNIPEYVNNYLPLLYTNSPYTTQEQKEADIVKDIENNIFMSDLINTSKSGTTISRVRPKVLKKGKKLSTNFHYDMIRKFREALYQVNTLKARKQVVKTLSNQEFADNFGVNNTETLREAVLRTVMAHQNAFEKNSFVNATMKVTNKLAGWGTRMALASPITGFFKQTLPVLSGAAVKLGKNSHFLWTLPRAKDGIFKYSNLHERIKTKAGFQTDTYTNDKELSTIHNQYKKGFIKAYGWTEEKAGKAADAVMWSITKGDQFAAKKAWMAYYASYLNKRKGIKSINWEKEFKNPSKEATAYADQLLEETQSTNSFATLGNFLLKKRDWGDILRNIYAPFSTFVLNQRSRLMNASRMIRKGNAKEGVEEIGAVAVESVVFSGIRISIGLGVIALSKELLQQLGYSDDEADKLIKDITLEDAIKRTGGDLAKDMLISGFVGADDKGAEAINWVYKKASGDSKDLLYVNKTTDRDYADWLGTYGIAFDNFADIYEDYKKLSEGYDDVVKGGGFGKEDLIKKPLTEREKDAFTLFLIHDIFKLVGSEQIFSNTINKVRRAIEKDMVQERGGAIDIKMYMKGDKYKEDKEKGRSRLSGGKITGGSLKRGKLKPRK